MSRMTTTFAIVSALLMSMASTARAAGGGPGGETSARAHVDGPAHEGVDRQGVYLGAGVSFGAAIVAPTRPQATTRVDALVGWGIADNALVGVDLFVNPGMNRGCGPVAFGGDVAGTGYAWRGLYFRGGMGLAQVHSCPEIEPEHLAEKDLGFGGAIGTGYELTLSQRSTIGIDLSYDARFVPDSRFPRHAGLAGLRLVFF